MSDRHGKDAQLFDDVYTDLAIEAHELAVERRGEPEIAGVWVDTETTPVAKISRVAIKTPAAAEMMGKAQGNYVTIESQAFKDRNREAQEELAQQIAREIQHFLQSLEIPQDGACLVVGLGNWNATPDALGPRAVSELLVTRHLYEMAPPELRGGLRPVAAMAPGVLGLTGIETMDIVRGVVDRIEPKLVICIDALAARSSDRLCTTVQLADTGIRPGAGVGNVRKGLSRETLGVPVLAVGVPTVIHAMTIVGDALDWITRSLTGSAAHENPPADGFDRVGGPVRLDPARINIRDERVRAIAKGEVQRGGTDPFGLPLDSAQKRYMIRQLLGPEFAQMIVTPKEVDALIEDVATCIAGALNAALHPSLELDDILLYLQG